MRTAGPPASLSYTNASFTPAPVRCAGPGTLTANLHLLHTEGFTAHDSSRRGHLTWALGSLLQTHKEIHVFDEGQKL